MTLAISGAMYNGSSLTLVGLMRTLPASSGLLLLQIPPQTMESRRALILPTDTFSSPPTNQPVIDESVLFGFEQLHSLLDLIEKHVHGQRKDRAISFVSPLPPRPSPPCILMLLGATLRVWSGELRHTTSGSPGLGDGVVTMGGRE